MKRGKNACCTSGTEEGKREACGVASEAAPVHLLVLASGSVAAIKLGELLDQLTQFTQPTLQLRVASTYHAQHFIERGRPSKTLSKVSPLTTQYQKARKEEDEGPIFYTDKDEWSQWNSTSDPVLHIELRRWADCVLIAPLDAHTLAKISLGLCDNLVTCIMRAMETKKMTKKKPVIVCPAMNTAMWDHPVTEEHLNRVRGLYGSGPSSSGFSNKSLGSSSWGRLPLSWQDALFQVVPPVEKRLACGDIGVGAMAPIEKIAEAVHHTAKLIQQHKQASKESPCVICRL